MWGCVSGWPQKEHRDRSYLRVGVSPFAKLEECAIQSNKCLVRRPLWRVVEPLVRLRIAIREEQWRVHLDGSLA